jgi:glyoxylase-like metal-dependent hydrolase (beta-lactamase superfamily II)
MADLGTIALPEIFRTGDVIAYKPSDKLFVFQTRKTYSATIYLLIGSRECLIIDSGMTMTDLTSAVRRITDKPLELALAHGHIDHVGAIGEFDHIYLHPVDRRLIPNYEGRVIDIHTGFRFDLGDRVVEVIEIPGHTRGSVAFLDVTNRLLFTGDGIGSKHCWMFLSGLPLEALLIALDRLEAVQDHFDQIWPGHFNQMNRVLTIDYVFQLKELTTQILEGW